MPLKRKADVAEQPQPTKKPGRPNPGADAGTHKRTTMPAVEGVAGDGGSDSDSDDC